MPMFMVKKKGHTLTCDIRHGNAQWAAWERGHPQTHIFGNHLPGEDYLKL